MGTGKKRIIPQVARDGVRRIGKEASLLRRKQGRKKWGSSPPRARVATRDNDQSYCDHQEKRGDRKDVSSIRATPGALLPALWGSPLGAPP